jgi:hypothetical protein
MAHTSTRPTLAEEGWPAEALSSEVLKLKIDDLFQEVENLKQQMERLERRADAVGASGPTVTRGKPGGA